MGPPKTAFFEAKRPPPSVVTSNMSSFISLFSFVLLTGAYPFFRKGKRYSLENGNRMGSPEGYLISFLLEGEIVWKMGCPVYGLDSLRVTKTIKNKSLLNKPVKTALKSKLALTEGKETLSLPFPFWKKDRNPLTKTFKQAFKQPLQQPLTLAFKRIVQPPC